MLNAEKVDDIGGLENIVDVVADLHAQLFKAFRHEGRGADKRDVRSEFEEPEDVRSGDATEKNVPDDRDIEAFDPAEFFADGEDVEQALGGMLVGAVSGVDDARVEAFGEELRGARRAVAEDDNVRPESLEVEGGVFEGLTLLEARGGGRDIDHIRTETHGGDLERRAGACAWLDEEVNKRLAAKGRDFLQAPLTDSLEGFCGIKKVGDFIRAEGIQSNEIFFCPSAHSAETMLTESFTPSSDSKRTRIFSSKVVGRFLPT